MPWPLTRLCFVALLFWGCSDTPNATEDTPDSSTPMIEDVGAQETDSTVPCEPELCDDGNPCTLNGCNGGACYTEPLTGQPCNDDNACTTNTDCLEDGSCGGGQNITCSDDNPCSIAVCKPKEGCVFEVTADGDSCSDGNPCTFPDACTGGTCLGTAVVCDEEEDGCQVFTGCQPEDGSCIYSNKANESTCDDGDLCTESDTCQSGVCTSGPAVSCEDNNPCTDDLCSPKSGCAFTPNQLNCDDGDLCTQGDTCGFGSCTGTAIACDDGDPCTYGACDGATGDCVVTTPSIPCDDGNNCTVGDVCTDGICTSGSPQPCDDQNPCTTDACDQDTGNCTFEPNQNPCNDDNQCTESDLCVNAACNGTPVSCNDNNECTSDTCDLSVGCQYSPINGECDDGNLCTVGEVCEEGTCGGGEFIVCDDDNPCTADACSDETGLCTFVNLTTGCDDDNACTTEDTCTAGECLGQQIDCEDNNICTLDSCNTLAGCENIPTEGSCDDGDNCTLEDLCEEGVCQPGAVPLCDDNNPCTFDLCNGATSDCGAIPQPGSCDDDNVCTTADTCAEGVCTGTFISVDDNNPCTDDSCDPEAGLQHEPNTNPCDDNDICTQTDACTEGLCVGSNNLMCDDGNPCTTDSCQSETGCAFEPNALPCDDGNLCTAIDLCQDTTCNPGEPVECDDGSPCTTQECLPDSGCVYTNTADPCDDDDPCTEGDTCLGGTCIGGFPIVCEDENPCTSEECVTGVGCVTSPLDGDCDDQNVCTLNDNCVAGFCTSDASLDCDDDNPCTNNLCNATEGCAYVNNSDLCDDGDACTDTDTCADSECSGTTITCNDDNGCTDDSCNSSIGCVFTPNTSSCDDGNACTLGDGCQDGVCQGTAEEDCDDDNQCTEDACDPESGCSLTPLLGACDDDDACTSLDQCSGGVCLGGPAVNCNDGNACTQEVCDTVLGCKYVFLTDACDDGDTCTEDDACLDGNCVGGPALECDDNNPCTDDTCNSTAGCIFTSNGASCDDGSVCTAVDSCSNGICAGSGELNCDDNNECTADECSEESGCTSTPVNQTCDDGNACTVNDFCSGGICTSNSVLECNDANGCTLDSCDPATGCTFEATTGSCDDGDLCTADDVCTDGICIGGSQVLCDDCDICTADTCDSALGCLHEVAPLPCSDGDGCTVDDICVDGVCSGTTCSEVGLACLGTTCGENTSNCISLLLEGGGEGFSFQTRHLEGSFTLETEVWLTSLAPAPASTHLMYVDSPENKLIVKAQDNGLWSVSWGVTGEESPLTWNAIGQNAALLNQWLHVAVTYDSASGERTLVINGDTKAADSGVPPFEGTGEYPASIGKGPEPFIAYPTVEGRFQWARLSSMVRDVSTFGGASNPTEADAWTENLFLMKERNDGVVADSGFFWRHGILSGGEWVNLDGSPVVDADQDGYSVCEGDCDDSNDLIHPGRGEICGDQIDNDCDGNTDIRDFDEDGWEGCSGQDCNDFSARVYPGAVELGDDGLDNNCDGVVDSLDSDDDMDGWNENQGDCDDGAPYIHPGAQEIPGNTRDEDCNQSAETLSEISNTVLYVDGIAGSDFFDGSSAFPKKTIGGALDIATPGTLVAVRETTYTEDVVVDGVHLVGGYGADWVPTGGQSALSGNLSVAPLSATGTTLSRFAIQGTLTAGASGGMTLHDVDVVTPEGTAVTTNSKHWVIAESTLTGAAQIAEAHTAALAVGSGGVSLWNSTVIAGDGTDGQQGDTGICCGIGVSAGDPGEKGESVYAVRTQFSAEKSCCDATPGTPGCGASLCEECVCAQLPECCTEGWSNDCVDIAQDIPCSILGCNGCPAPTATASIINGTLLQGGRAGDGGQGGNAFNNNYACGVAGDGGDTITLSMEQVRIQGTAVYSGIAGNGASQIGTSGYTASCNGGKGGIDRGLSVQNSVLEQLHVISEVRPGQATGGLPAEPLSESPQGPQTFSDGLGGILQGLVQSGESTTRNSTLELTSNSGFLREVSGATIEEGELSATRILVNSASYAEGVLLFDSTALLNSVVHHLLYPGTSVAAMGIATTISSSTIVAENPGAAIAWGPNSSGGTLVNTIAVTGEGGTCLLNEGTALSAIQHNLVNGCTDKLYYDGLYRTQALELDFLLPGGQSGGHLFTDPFFEGTTEGNFALASCSPAIDAGLDASASEFGGILTDVEGEARPYGASHDIGAFEYTPAALGN